MPYSSLSPTLPSLTTNRTDAVVQRPETRRLITKNSLRRFRGAQDRKPVGVIAPFADIRTRDSIER